MHYAKQGYANEVEAAGAVAGNVGSRLIQGNVCSCLVAVTHQPDLVHQMKRFPVNSDDLYDV